MPTLAIAEQTTSIPGYTFDQAPDLSSEAVRQKLTPNAIRLFTNIVRKWALNEEQARSLLGGIASSTYHGWRTNPKNKKLDQDTLMRISLIIGIYKGLHLYFGDTVADRWITSRNRGYLFAGRTPLEFMIRAGKPGMADVRRLIDSWRGGRV